MVQILLFQYIFWIWNSVWIQAKFGFGFKFFKINYYGVLFGFVYEKFGFAFCCFVYYQPLHSTYVIWNLLTKYCRKAIGTSTKFWQSCVNSDWLNVTFWTAIVVEINIPNEYSKWTVLIKSNVVIFQFCCIWNIAFGCRSYGWVWVGGIGVNIICVANYLIFTKNCFTVQILLLYEVVNICGHVLID